MKVKLVAIKPKKALIDLRDFERAAQDALDNAAYDAMALYEDSTQTWTHKPGFYIRKTNSTRTVSTKSKIFGYVDLGTRAHVIRPKRAKILKFKTGGFKAKTQPGRIPAMRGAAARNPVVARTVHHPGTEARGISKEIQKRMEKSLGVEMRKAMKRLVSK